MTVRSALDLDRADGGMGAEPQLLWLDLDCLLVDERYQRTLDTERARHLIARIARQFRWSAFGAVLCCQGAAGHYLLLDGQHRCAAARARGLKRVPAVVVAALSLEEQAEAFVRANQARSPVHGVTLHYAALLAGDKDERRIAAVIRRAGLAVPKTPRPAGKLKPGEFLAIGAAHQLLRRGEEHAALVLGCLARALRDDPGRIRGTLIRAVSELIVERGPGAGAAIERVLGATAARDFDRGVLKQMQKGFAGADAVAETIAALLPKAASA